MTTTLTLIRGLPGSGKSTLAKTMAGIHLEADMYFVRSNGEYHYRPEKIRQAHQWCQQKTSYWLSKGENVVVANTFVCQWEMDAYKKIARQFKAKLKIVVCRESYANIHGVDEKTVQRMREQWQE